MKIGGQTNQNVRVECKCCEKKFTTPISTLSHKRCCSVECDNKYRTIIGESKGENNGRYNSKLISCTNCGKNVLAPKYKYKQTNSFGDNHVFLL